MTDLTDLIERVEADRVRAERQHFESIDAGHADNSYTAGFMRGQAFAYSKVLGSLRALHHGGAP